MLDTQEVPQQFTEELIKQRIEDCPKLASLRSINTTLSALMRAETSVTSQIAEVIRRDPALTARILRIVNSSFFGLSTKIAKIEDAIFYLGIRQVRELALATPIIEEFASLHSSYSSVNWPKLWQHSIGTAILTREILSIVNYTCSDDTDYITGLVHSVGQIVMAYTIPEHFMKIIQFKAKNTQELLEFERSLIVWDHAQIGAYYLKKHNMPTAIIEGVQFQHSPDQAQTQNKLAAAVQVANSMARHAGIISIEAIHPTKTNSWLHLEGWKILFGETPSKHEYGLSSLNQTISRLPKLLQGMI